MKVNKLTQVTACVGNIDEHLKLYCDVMGFEIEDRNIVEGPEAARSLGFADMDSFKADVCCLTIPSGETLKLVQFINPTPITGDVRGISSLGKMHVAYLCDDAYAWEKKLKDAGYEFVYKPIDVGDGIWFYIYDPDGTIVEFTQKFALHPDTLKFLHLGHTVQDIDKAMDFYGNLMGMETISPVEYFEDAEESLGLGYPDTPVTMAWTSLIGPREDQPIELLSYKVPETEPGGQQTLSTISKQYAAFEVDDLEAACKDLEAYGLEKLCQAVNTEGQAVAFYTDCEGTAFKMVEK